MTEVKFTEINISKDDLDTADQAAAMIELCTLHSADNKQFWVYISILPSKYKEYKLLHQKGGHLNLSEFGTIIQSGWGKTPPKEIQEVMKAKHGTSSNYEDDLINSINSKITNQNILEE